MMEYSGPIIRTMSELSLLDWATLLTGWDRRWLSREDVSKYAVDWLVSRPDETDDRVALLAGAESLDEEEIRDLLHRLVGDDAPSGAEAASVDKWRLAHLVELAERETDDESRLDALEMLYADFNYPEDMAACSRYYVEPNARESSEVGAQLTSPLDGMRHLIDTLKSRFCHGV